MRMIIPCLSEKIMEKKLRGLPKNIFLHIQSLFYYINETVRFGDFYHRPERQNANQHLGFILRIIPKCDLIGAFIDTAGFFSAVGKMEHYPVKGITLVGQKKGYRFFMESGRIYFFFVIWFQQFTFIYTGEIDIYRKSSSGCK